MRKRIGIEAQRIFRKNKHGMDYVILEEIRQLQKMQLDCDIYVFVSPGDDRCLEDSGNVHIVEVKCPTYPLWEQYALPRAAKRLKVDLLHCTSNTAPMFTDIPLVLTLHDIIFLEPRDKANKSLYQNLGWYYRRFVVPRILSKCKRIITVSNFEYNNIQEKLHIGNRLRMIYNSCNERFRPLDNVDKVCNKYISETGYFFFLGNTDPKKNTLRTLQAYSHYLDNSEIKRPLLLADFTKDDLTKLAVDNHIENIIEKTVCPGYIENTDLPYIYNGCFAFVYTSLRESFGIPLLEAMSSGVPVITSNTSSMPEIASDAALFISPNKVDEISEAMLRLEKDEALYKDLKEKGLERASHFSWRKSTEKLLEIYHEVLSE